MRKLNVYARLAPQVPSATRFIQSPTQVGGETNITWNNKPARVTALTTNSVSGTNWFLYDVSTYVKSQLAAGQNIVSVALHDPTNYNLFISVYSRENSTNKPALVIVATNSPLSVSITNPANNSLFAGPTNLTITASVFDSDGTVTQVQFFQGATSLGLLTNTPYSLTWSNVAAGTYALTALASDSSGLLSTSSVVSVIVNIPPSITTQPTNQTVKQGSNAVFTVAAAGTAPLSFRWQLNGTNLPGATNVSLTITNVQSTNTGNYSVIVTNVVGSVTSSNAVLALLTAPAITAQPTNQTVTQGSNVTFSVAASGTAPLSFQWWFNTTNLFLGATNLSLTVTNVQSTNAGIYSVVVTNVAGSVNSSNAVLTVRVPPSITTQPTNQTVKQGSNAVFTVTAAGTAPLSYRWQFNGTNLSGATNVSLTITNVQSTNTGNYSVIVTNVVGSVTSSNAVLTLLTTPAISVQPTNQTVTQGSNVTFSVTATGTAPLNYQWRFNTTNLLFGATNLSFTITNVQSTNAGNYSVVVTNVAGSVTSSNAMLTVLVPPSITTQPTNQTVKQGSNAVFTVTATGTAPLSYRWQFNGTNLAGATNVSLTITNVQSTNTGNYSVIVTNVVGSVTSSNGVLALMTAPAITVQPTNQTVTQGSNVTFSVTATGTAPLNYQWRLNTTNLLTGATNVSLTLLNTQPTNAGNYSVVVTNVMGSVTSSNAVLTVLIPPSISAQPTNQTVRQGSNVVFIVTAAGTAPLRYLWQFNGANLVGATNLTLTITNAQPTNAGNYSVVVTNMVGSVTSSNANLTVLVPPSITIQPTNQTAIQSGSVTFSVTATGTAPLSYQWWFNATNLLPGATNLSLTVTNVQPTNAGNYSVVVTNVLGSVTSSNAVLTVLVPPSIMTQPTNQTGIQGGSVTLSVNVTGTAPLYYQWWFNTTNLLPGATNLSLTVTNVQPTNAGHYSVVVTNVVGSVTSSNVVLTVLVPPVVTITNPANNSLVVAGSNIALGASASSQFGTIQQVQFFQGTNLLGVSFSAPYGSIWVNPGSGVYSLTAVAIDSNGLSTTSSVVNVTVDLLPSVTLTGPANGTVFVGVSTNLTLTAVASDPDGSVTNVQFFQGKNNLGISTSSPYTVAWNNVLPGSYGLTAVATDNNGLTATSSVVSITVTPVSIAITNPIDNTILCSSLTNVVLAATTGDLAGNVVQVQFYQGTYSLGAASNIPYSITWSNVPAGNYALTAVALDNNGYTATSSVVNLFITPLFASNNFRLWLKADAITGLTNGATVGTWPDCSGWSNNATQGTQGQQPLYIANALNGLPVVRFNPTNDQDFSLPSILNGTTGAEAFVVLRAAADAAPRFEYMPLWHFGLSGYGGLAYPDSSGNILDDFGSTSYYTVGDPAQPLDQYHVYEVAGATNYWSAWINGVLQSSTTNNIYGITASPMLGYANGNYFAGDMAEVLVFNRTLTASERLTVNYYLDLKYGLVTVPAAPTNLVATTVSTNQISLTWSFNLGTSVTSFEIERATSSNGVYQVVATVASTLSYVDTNLPAGTTYYYEVAAMNAAGVSGNSNPAWAATLSNGVSLPLGNLLLWLKADSGLVLENTNNSVKTWYDQSGNGNNASQGTQGQQPLNIANALNGMPVVRFNPTNNQCFSLPNLLNGTTGAEAFVVLRAAADVAPRFDYMPLWHFGTSWYGGLAYPDSSGNILDDFGSSSVLYGGRSSTAVGSVSCV